MKKKVVLIIFVIIALIKPCSLAHSGRTDGYGGHYNRSTGTYHYHTGAYSGEYTAPVEEGGIRIDKNKYASQSNSETKLKVNMNDTRDFNAITEENDRLKTEVETKRNSINNMNNKIKEQEAKIGELEDSKTWLHIIYITIIIIMLIYVYKHLE